MLSYVLSCVLCCPSTPCNIYVAFSIPLFILCVCVCVHCVCVCTLCVVWYGGQATEKTSIEFSHPELSSFFSQLERVQQQLDGLSS